MPSITHRTCSLIAGLALATIGIATATAQNAAVYKWVDDSGQTHYTDRPQEADSVIDTGIRYRRTDPAGVQDRVAASRKTFDADRKQAQEASEQAAEDRADREASAQERREDCDRAKERMQSYETAHRLYREGADGEREYLNSEEIDAERENARQDVNKWCR